MRPLARHARARTSSMLAGVIAGTALASGGALATPPTPAPVVHESRLCGAVRGAHWTAAGRSGNKWYVAAEGVSCRFADSWAIYLTHARIIHLGNGNEYFAARVRFPHGFGCVPKTKGIRGVKPYAEGVCEKQVGKIAVAFTWGIIP